MTVKCKIRKDDRVEVKSGRNRGKIGKVKKILAEGGRVRVLVEGVNMVVRHTKASSAGEPSGKVEKEAPLDISNVALLCPRCGEAARVGLVRTAATETDKSRKSRVCKKCREIIDEDK